METRKINPGIKKNIDLRRRSKLFLKKLKLEKSTEAPVALIIVFFLLSLTFAFLLVRYSLQEKPRVNLIVRQGKKSDEYQVAYNSDLGVILLTVPETAPQKKEPVFSKGIYITAWTAATENRLQNLINLVKRTELNTVVIDVKDCTGKIFFDADVPLADKIGAEELRIRDLPGLIKKLREEKIYTIARIAVFEDPYLAQKNPRLALKDKRNGRLWKNNQGIAWVDPASEEVWDYNLRIAKAAAKIGFDEVNFDYIRFPSDGNLSQISYPFWDGQTPKYEVIRSFAEYLRKNLKSGGIFTSADLFGLAFYQDDDLNIGQKLSEIIPYFDYLCPMAYPSHYWTGFEGYKNPALYPYEVVYKTLSKANPLLKGYEAKFRPWLQDFDMGAVYDASMVKKQIHAAYDADAFGWLLWNASNNYTEAALLPEK